MTPPVVVISRAQRWIGPQDQRIFRIAMLCRSAEVIAASNHCALFLPSVDYHGFIVGGGVPVVVAQQYLAARQFAHYGGIAACLLGIEQHGDFDAASLRTHQCGGNPLVGEAVGLHQNLLARFVDGRNDHAVGGVARRKSVLHCATGGECGGRCGRL